MSDESYRGAGSDDARGRTARIGTVERDEAVALLGDHWRAGRLDPGEHELRVTRARASVTQADLDELFTDLPSTGVSRESPGTAATPGVRGFLESKRDTIIALAPFAALILFFTTGYNWLWFLLIPVMGILLYGPNGAKPPKPKRRSGRRGEHP